MNKSMQAFEQCKSIQLVALLTPSSPEQCVQAYEILDKHDILLEIAFRSEGAVDGIHAVRKRYPSALLLAGTVMTAEQAESAIEAGVAGVVSADYIPEVVDICVQHDVMCIPGGLSDAGKQLHRKAKGYGCTLETLREEYPYQWIYKLFPAVTYTGSNTGLSKAWQGPYKGLNIVYTGGVSLKTLPELVKQDPDGIFCGSALTKHIDDPLRMEYEIRQWKEAVARKSAVIQKKPAESPSSSGKVVTFGEIMLRLSPPDHLRFVQTDSYNATYGGAEANTAVAFANYGLESQFVSALPAHEIGQCAINLLRSYGVDTSAIQRQGERVGIYFLEFGASQRPSKVIYDRAGSSISELQPGQVDWDSIFSNASWFHWSGITPALSDSAAEVTIEALKAAKKHGVTVSVDLNYRKKLWMKEKAGAVMRSLMPYVDICIGNEEDAAQFFGITAGSMDLDAGDLDRKEYEMVAKELLETFGLQKVAITLRKSISASDNEWSACLYNGKEFLLSNSYAIHIVDRVGGGDSFSSGLIYALIDGMDDRNALEFGVAASCLKQTIFGDYNLVTVEEVQKLAAGATSGRVQR